LRARSTRNRMGLCVSTPNPPPRFSSHSLHPSPPQTISISTLHKKNGDDDEKVLPSRRFRLDLTLTLTSHPAASQLASFPFYLYPSLVLSRLFGLFHPSFLLFAFFPFSPLMPLRMNDTSLSLSLLYTLRVWWTYQLVVGSWVRRFGC
jgi:hypothetical protein